MTDKKLNIIKLILTLILYIIGIFLIRDPKIIVGILLFMWAYSLERDIVNKEKNNEQKM